MLQAFIKASTPIKTRFVWVLLWFSDILPYMGMDAQNVQHCCHISEEFRIFWDMNTEKWVNQRCDSTHSYKIKHNETRNTQTDKLNCHINVSLLFFFLFCYLLDSLLWKNNNVDLWTKYRRVNQVKMRACSLCYAHTNSYRYAYKYNSSLYFFFQRFMFLVNFSLSLS